jgi:LPLT family lysophospholipid transporter-like MFS transporter
VTLETVSRCMPAGILIGVVVLIFSLQHSLLPAYALLMLIGVWWVLCGAAECVAAGAG